MNTLKILLAAPLLGSLLFSSCLTSTSDGIYGSGETVTEVKNYPKFRAVELEASADVNVQKDSFQCVALSDYENLIEYWDLVVKDSTLHIRTKPHANLLNSRALISLNLPYDIEEIRLTGSGEIRLLSPMAGLHGVVISGSGDVRGLNNTNYARLSLLVSGSGSIGLNGQASRLSARISGSGDLMLEGLFATYAECAVSGSGDVRIGVKDVLKADISGSGDIRYKGDPQVHSSVTGSGDIVKL